eukprot:11256304-Alexandrium_andersonii.AAC.1
MCIRDSRSAHQAAWRSPGAGLGPLHKPLEGGPSSCGREAGQGAHVHALWLCLQHVPVLLAGLSMHHRGAGWGAALEGHVLRADG